VRNLHFVLAALCSLYSIACSDKSASDGDDSSSMMQGGAGSEDDPFGNGAPSQTQDGGLLPQQDGMVETEPPGECGSTTVAAQSVVTEEEVTVETEVTVVKPVALYIMFDKSYSMSLSGLWDPAVEAMKSFIDDEASVGLLVGLQYFPSGGSCDTGAGYDTPAVAVGELPDHADALSASLDGEDADGYGTPIEGALRGVTEFCKQYQVDHEESCVAVLVTDGKPEYASGCEEDTAALAAIAADAHTAGVTTFAVGLQGADFDVLDAIAEQGGAPDCDSGAGYACDVSSGADELTDALVSIRDTVVEIETHTETVTHVDEHRLPCEWELPEVPEGQLFDRNKVNIKLTSDVGERNFGRVASPDACEEDGWHFDDADNPTRILACPETCAVIEALPDAKIDILLGCATIALE
jgi:hypothetical protein